MRTLIDKLLAAAKLSAVLALFLLLQPQEARADYLFFTDQSAYNAALAQAGVTQQPVRFNEPGTLQSGSVVTGFVTGRTLSGPDDLTVAFGGIGDLTTSASGIQGTSGSFTALVVNLYHLEGPTFPQFPLRGDFRSLSGFIEIAPGGSGTLFLSAFNFFNFKSSGISLNVTSGGPIFFGVLGTGDTLIHSVSLSAFGNLSMTSATQLQVGDPAAVPEPATLLLLGTGLAGAAGLAQRRRRGRRGDAA